MYNGPGLEYVRAEFGPPDKNSIDAHQPPPFKVYAQARQIPLPGLSEPSEPSELALPGQLLLSICGLTHQVYRLPPDIGEAFPAFLTSLHRPVPSGGALFPWECYLCVGPDQLLPPGIYHYDNAHHALDILRQGDFMDRFCAAMARPPATRPACMLALSCFFWKDAFKYRIFSYRLQGFDIGTIIGQALEVFDRHNLQTTVSFQFLDEQLNQLLDLPYLHESVYAVMELNLPAASHKEHTRAAEQDIEADAVVPTAPRWRSLEEWPLLQELHSASLYRSGADFRASGCLPALTAPQTLASHVLPPVTQPLDLLVMQHRRHSIWGRFSPVPIDEQQLADLLQAAHIRYRNDLDGETVTSRHTQLYCVINRVNNVVPGVYYYDPLQHALGLIVTGDMRTPLQHMLRFQTRSMYEVGLCIFLVGSYEAGFEAYGDRWYRMQHMDAGIVVQRLYLAAAALGLGCMASEGFLDARARALLHLPEGQHALIQVMLGVEGPACGMYQQPIRL